LKIPKGGNQNSYIEEEQTTQWPKEKVQKDKQLYTKHTHKTKDRVMFVRICIAVVDIQFSRGENYGIIPLTD
jgi:hypothetical protein